MTSFEISINSRKSFSYINIRKDDLTVKLLYPGDFEEEKLTGKLDRTVLVGQGLYGAGIRLTYAYPRFTLRMDLTLRKEDLKEYIEDFLKLSEDLEELEQILLEI